jgi:predicted AlkP superfamily phosphohydrolase/phosphomutase
VPRILVVGLDGATPDVAWPLMEQGRMPVLQRLAHEGAFGPMRSVFPYNSAVAWTSLVTGRNPGVHGVFDFVLPRQDAYSLRVATRHDRRVPAMWNVASEAGARVGVVNIPMTFPAEAVNGAMVSGMDAPKLEPRAVHPPSLLQRIADVEPGYRIMSKAYLRAEQGDFEAAERELLDTMISRSRFTADLARARDLDLLLVNLEATDGSQHFFWQHADPGHPRFDPGADGRSRDAIGRVYEASDREVGRLIDAFEPDTVFVVSDHGGGPSNDRVLFMNDWLVEEGFLALRPAAGAALARRAYGAALKRMSVPLKRRLRPVAGKAIERGKRLALYGDVDWEASRAYAFVQAMVRLNVQGREPRGVVRPEERDEVLRELGELARARRLPDGRALFSRVAPAIEVYPGPAPAGPDLVLEPLDGLEVRGRNASGRPGFLLTLEDLGTFYPSGVHTPVGIVVAAGTGIRAAGLLAETDIHQVTPSILALLGVPAPVLDAPPLPFVNAPLTTAREQPHVPDEEPTPLTDQEEAEVLERLRGMGYVD